VLTYDSKIIGLDIEKRNPKENNRLYSGIVMTAASPLNADATADIDLVMMDDPEIWGSYEDTLQFLTFISKETKAKIPCLPRIQVIDDGHLIGVMTETNQFMEIRPHIAEPLIQHPAGVKPLDIVAYNTTNPNAADAEVQTGSHPDIARVRYVQRIQLETEMYELFRNSMRIMINKIKNMDKKKRLEDIVSAAHGGDVNYHDKIREIMRICQEMGDPFIQFTMMSDAVLDAFISEHEFKPRSTAFMRCITAENRIEYGPNTCMRVVNPDPAVGGDCRILLPHNNLINGIDNRTFYYGKLADELLRYTRIRRFILSASSTFTSLMTMAHDLHDNEIILLHSQLEHYFDHLEPGAGIMNRFARYNTFDTANPELNPGEVPSSKYVGTLGPGVAGPGVAGPGVAGPGVAGPGVEDEEEIGSACAPFAIKPLSGAAARYFPKTANLLAFENATGECTFGAFLSIMRDERAEYADADVRELKAILVSKYIELMRTHKVQMMHYYKHLTANRTVLAANAENFIMNAFHYMTHLDLLILAQHFRIPVVLFSAQIHYPLVENQRACLVLYRDPAKDEANSVFYYIATMGRARDVAPVYSIVRSGTNDMKFSLAQCDGAFVEQVATQLMVGVAPVSEFIAGYVPKKVALKAVAEAKEDE
jgi:hypothetical protein